MRKTLPLVLLLLLSLVARAAAQEDLKPVLAKIDLKEGDTLVFLGDSITHQCLYTQYVEDYFYTRYPQLRIRFHNAGIGGDRAWDGLMRLDDDVLAHKPKYVTILLGMNDGSYQGFNQEIFDKYEKDMTTLLDRIAASGAVAVPMTPTMFDLRAVLLNPKRKAQYDKFKVYNGVLAFYGSWLREQAIERGLGWVDMYSPLNNITIEERKTDANFTMIPDAVHPAAPGQVVMAFAILNDMHREGQVSAINAVRAGDKWRVTGANGKVTDVSGDENSVTFTFTSNSLPWVLPPEAALGYKLTKAGHKLSNERVRVAGLPTGKYEVKIDGVSVGTWPDLVLGSKIELQENDKTPQYQQALAVAMMNKERNEKTVRSLRNAWAQVRNKYRAGEHERDPDAFKTWYTEQKKQMDALVEQARAEELKIYDAAQPKPRRYEITRVP